MKVLVLLALAVIMVLAILWIAGTISRWWKGRNPWHVDVSKDGSNTLVQVARKQEQDRRIVIAELPPATDSVEFQAELQMALEDAEALVNRLNNA